MLEVSYKYKISYNFSCIRKRSILATPFYYLGGNMDLDYAIKLVRSIGECEVGTMKKIAINRVLEELYKYMETKT